MPGVSKCSVVFWANIGPSILRKTSEINLGNCILLKQYCLKKKCILKLFSPDWINNTNKVILLSLPSIRHLSWAPCSLVDYPTLIKNIFNDLSFGLYTAPPPVPCMPSPQAYQILLTMHYKAPPGSVGQRITKCTLPENIHHSASFRFNWCRGVMHSCLLLSRCL